MPCDARNRPNSPSIRGETSFQYFHLKNLPKKVWFYRLENREKSTPKGLIKTKYAHVKVMRMVHHFVWADIRLSAQLLCAQGNIGPNIFWADIRLSAQLGPILVTLAFNWTNTYSISSKNDSLSQQLSTILSHPFFRSNNRIEKMLWYI